MAQLSEAQKIPSSCETQDSIAYWYEKDAARLCLKQYDRQGSTYNDSIHFPAAVFEPKLEALIAVFNAKSIPEADTVTRIREIHEFPGVSLNSIVIYADSTLPWMKAFRNNQFPTGNTTLDSILIRYKFMLSEYNDFPVFGQHTVILNSLLNLNLSPLTRELDDLGINASPNGGPGDGNRLIDSVYSDHIEILYTYAWGDCPAGCIFQRSWKFKVYEDCSVEFIESYGQTLPPPMRVSQVENTNWTIYPNPFSKELTIGNIKGNFSYLMFSMDGRMIHVGQGVNGQIDGLAPIPNGLYLIRIETEQGHRNFKVFKD